MDAVVVRELLMLLGAATIVFFARKNLHELAQLVAQGIDNFKNGGRPGPPSHPLPADDSRILNRRARIHSSRKAAIGSRREARRAGK